MKLENNKYKINSYVGIMSYNPKEDLLSQVIEYMRNKNYSDTYIDAVLLSKGFAAKEIKSKL